MYNSTNFRPPGQQRAHSEAVRAACLCPPLRPTNGQDARPAALITEVVWRQPNVGRQAGRKRRHPVRWPRTRPASWGSRCLACRRARWAPPAAVRRQTSLPSCKPKMRASDTSHRYIFTRPVRHASARRGVRGPDCGQAAAQTPEQQWLQCPHGHGLRRAATRAPR